MKSLVLNAVRCPYCGASDCAAGEESKTGKRRLKCVFTKRIGDTRQAVYMCREPGCGKTFRVNWRLRWRPKTDQAVCMVIDG